MLWPNLSGGQPDPRVLHEGVAPKACEKLAMNVWVADRPFELERIAAWRARQPADAAFVD